MLKVIEGAELRAHKTRCYDWSEKALEAVREAALNGVSFDDCEEGHDLVAKTTRAPSPPK